MSTQRVGGARIKAARKISRSRSASPAKKKSRAKKAPSAAAGCRYRRKSYSYVSKKTGKRVTVKASLVLFKGMKNKPGCAKKKAAPKRKRAAKKKSGGVDMAPAQYVVDPRMAGAGYYEPAADWESASRFGGYYAPEELAVAGRYGGYAPEPFRYGGAGYLEPAAEPARYGGVGYYEPAEPLVGGYGCGFDPAVDSFEASRYGGGLAADLAPMAPVEDARLGGAKKKRRSRSRSRSRSPARKTVHRKSTTYVNKNGTVVHRRGSYASRPRR